MHYSLIKPLLFRLQPEAAHDLILRVASLSPTLGALSGIKKNPRLNVRVGRVDWTSPIGLAAGLDKNAEALDFFDQQGFGAIECGTITLKPQDGNPKPRMFRYPDEESLRNAMGFPNKGLLTILPKLRSYQGATPVGANLGKNKDTTPEDSIEELGLLMESLNGLVDYFVINVSSPNTPGLRALQEKSYLKELFSELRTIRQSSPVDLYLKLAPDLEEKKIKELTHLAVDMGLTGLIATNTTIMADRGIGGVSGKLLNQKARHVRSLILGEGLPLELIGVGGISQFQDLLDFWSMGGKAVQIYTSYVYQGPDILKHFQHHILKFLDKNNFQALEDFLHLPLPEKQRLISLYNP